MEQPEDHKKQIEGQLSAAGEQKLWKEYYRYLEEEQENNRAPDDPMRWMRRTHGIRVIRDTIEEGQPVDPQKGYLYFEFDDYEKAQNFLKTRR